ncbi:hypothetical protein CAL7102_03893 [Dulcicalothrix desertica PCC 7102]|nr:hypothetical protein CAL7102_03893 [Dulcicalothrix desertica PCC 7102]
MQQHSDYVLLHKIYGIIIDLEALTKYSCELHLKESTIKILVK